MLPQISPRQAIWKTPMTCKRNIQSWISWLSKKYLPKNSRRFFNFKFYLLSKLVLKETVLQSWNNIPFNIFSENCERKPSFQMQIKRWGLIKQMCHHPLFSFSTNHEAMKVCSIEFQMSTDLFLKLRWYLAIRLLDDSFLWFCVPSPIIRMECVISGTLLGSSIGWKLPIYQECGGCWD